MSRPLRLALGTLGGLLLAILVPTLFALFG
jgi:hypothetical protein